MRSTAIIAPAGLLMGTSVTGGGALIVVPDITVIMPSGPPISSPFHAPFVCQLEYGARKIPLTLAGGLKLMLAP